MRLIDADRLKEVFRRNTVCDYADIIDNAPTVCDIDAIRAEIEQEHNDCKMREMFDEAYGFEKSLEIIDKHTKGEQE